LLILEKNVLDKNCIFWKREREDK